MADIDPLLELMEKLRDKDKGCPWDIKQDHNSIAHCSIEEAYELVAAITKNDQEKMSAGLQRLAAEDPSFRIETDLESGQTIMKGMGELHLDILVDRLKREFKVEANIGAPQVAYRETISVEAEVDYTHKKQSGGAGQFARVKMVITPTETGEGYSFESKL